MAGHPMIEILISRSFDLFGKESFIKEELYAKNSKEGINILRNAFSFVYNWIRKHLSTAIFELFRESD